MKKIKIDSEILEDGSFLNLDDNSVLDFEDSYCKYVEEMVDKGYIDYEGTPIKCPHCGGKKLEQCNREVGGYNIPDGCLTEFDMCCKECGEVVAHWAYGGWEY